MNNKKTLIVLLTIICFQFWSCENNNQKNEVERPSHVEDIEGTDISKVTFTEKAIERIGLQTAMVVETHFSERKLVVPYSSILYDPQGGVWVYTNPQPNIYIRQNVDVDYIKGDMVYLNDGPPAGTLVVSVGTAEVYGAEFEVGH